MLAQISIGSSGRVGGAKKHEIYVAAFGGHLFYDLFVQGLGGGGPWPPRHPPGSATADSKRLELDPSLRHIIVSRLCYLSFGGDVISKLEMHEDVLSPWMEEYDSDQRPWWSSGYNAVPDNERLGFDPPLRHRIFLDHVTFSTHCYII